MNIISQILNFETKNIIINTIICKLRENLFNLFEKLLFDFSLTRYTSFMLNLQQVFFEEIRNTIVIFIESIDKTYPYL